MHSLPRLIVIVGPTASGKTQLALHVAKRMNGYILSADSRQIYQGLDIGTAKATSYEQRQVPHFLIDLTTPDTPLAVHDIQRLAYEIIKKQHTQHPNSIPILVGGTGLYVNAILDHWHLPPGQPNTRQRAVWEKTTVQELATTLKKINPQLAKTVDLKNKRRVIRSLEIAQAQLQAQHLVRQQGPKLFDSLLIGIQVDKHTLDQRINQRVEEQIEQGLVSEVKNLSKKYTWDLPALSGIGYTEIGDFLQGKVGLPTAIQQIKLHTRQYARRQMTWFKKDKRIHWVTSQGEADQLINAWLKQRNEGTSATLPES